MYCQKINGSENFSIDDWNEQYEALEKSKLSEAEKQKILFPDKCNKQCEDCRNIVKKRVLRTRELINKSKQQ